MTHHRLTVLLAVLALVLFSTATAAAQGATKRVALVIQFPGRTYTEIVTVPAGANTTQVLEAALIPVGTNQFGSGTALCNIDGVGNPVDDCFADPDEYWAYYHLAGSQWQTSLVGTDSVIPADRAVEGFAWSGFDANFNPTVQPPVKTFAEIEAEHTPPPPNEVPEPATILLLGGGLAGLAAYARRRRSVRV